MPTTDFVTRCRELLSQLWAEVASPNVASADAFDAALSADIHAIINSDTKSYRYVLPTQLLAKAADATLDCRCIQKKRGGPGAFDARSIAHEVIVPFDREQHSVLGGSAEPYLSKPLRCKDVSSSSREDKKDKAGWDTMCRVLDVVQSTDAAAFTQAALLVALQAVFERLGVVRIVYPVPNRVSLDSAMSLLEAFLADRTGGVRFESIAAALFVQIGRRFSLYSSVRRTAVNSADSQSGAAGDIECLDAEGRVVTVVEAKDRQIAVRHVQDKLPTIREIGIREAFFFSSMAASSDEAVELDGLVKREFASGQNLYLVDAASFLRMALSLFGEDGRREFLREVGGQLDEFARLSDRQRWAALLGDL